MESKYVPNFGEIIKEYRKKEGKTQKEIAMELGVSRGAYSLYESGDRLPTVDTAVLIAATLGISLDEIFAAEKIYLSDFYSKAQEKTIISDFRTLNQNGKSKASQYVRDLTKIPEYRIDSDQDHDQE